MRTFAGTWRLSAYELFRPTLLSWRFRLKYLRRPRYTGWPFIRRSTDTDPASAADWRISQPARRLWRLLQRLQFRHLMRRELVTPRSNWQQKVEEVGLEFHTQDGVPYWAEDRCYAFTA